MTTEIYFKPARQIENTGDLLINKSEIDLLRKYGQIIIDNSSTPDWYINELSPDGLDTLITSFSKESLYKTILKRLREKKSGEKKAIYLILPPGHTARKGRQMAKNTFNNFLRLYLLKLNGCKIIRTGFSIGPFDKLNGIVEALNSRAYYHCSVRDKSSLSLAKELNFKDTKYAPDLAWAYEPNNVPVGEKSYFVVSMRSNSYGEAHSSEYLLPIKERMLTILSAVLPKDARIIFAYQVNYDKEACFELCDYFKPTFRNAEVHDRKLLLDDAVRLYAGAKCVFSNRLHVLLLAMQSKTLAIPFINDIDNRKITSIYTDNGLAPYMLYSDMDVNKQISNLEHVLSNEKNVMELFTTLVKTNKEKIAANLDNVFHAV